MTDPSRVRVDFEGSGSVARPNSIHEEPEDEEIQITIQTVGDEGMNQQNGNSENAIGNSGDDREEDEASTNIDELRRAHSYLRSEIKEMQDLNVRW
eukprot:CAMPEP_0114987176 /NCGR_PEP_ID=MMETSP0216-20121206/8855_1 /TAXON_ID=223996 /ORGANISM="Protocruzia adherens, Strain Boccale" /LENGTH=95 /DNA_ID=CAMNT_0002349731 /DNA_START=47 /DNA_END=331 /DNA_ORIENTATION=-